MSNTLIDERYKENKMRAQSTANKTALSIIFLQYPSGWLTEETKGFILGVDLSKSKRCTRDESPENQTELAGF